MERAVAALVAFLTALSDRLLAMLTGSAITQAKSLKNELEAVERANKAAAGVDVMSDDDVVRYLKQRGLYRLVKQPGERS